MTVRQLEGEQTLMRIFVGESDRHGHQPLYLALVETLRRHGLAGATVLRGVAGFGASSVVHTTGILRLSADLPIVVEVVDAQERLERVLPALDAMMGGGLVTMERVRVIRYAGGTTAGRPPAG